jgi:hypothetical protein
MAGTHSITEGLTNGNPNIPPRTNNGENWLPRTGTQIITKSLALSATSSHAKQPGWRDNK